MKKNYTMRDYIREFPTADYFYRLYIVKKPKFKKENAIKIIIYLLKHGAGALYLKKIQAESIFIQHSTRFFPFSHFFLASPVHYRNTEMRKIQSAFEKISLWGFPLIITEQERNDNFSEARGHFLTAVKDFDISLQITQKLIQKYFPGVFVRKYDKGRINILIPNEIYPEIIKYDLKKIKDFDVEEYLNG